MNVMTDVGFVYKQYIIGTNSLIDLLGLDHERIYEVYAYQQRLEENIRKAVQYGDNPVLQSDRSEIISHLNRIAFSEIRAPFNDLCREIGEEAISTQKEYGGVLQLQNETLPISSWVRCVDTEKSYEEKRNKLLLHVKNEEYEAAVSLYWELMYFTGTRELWEERELITNKILKQSIEQGDHKISSLILARANAWPLIHVGRYEEAKRILVDSHEEFIKSKDKAVLTVFYEHLAEVYNGIGNVGKSKIYYKLALDGARGIKRDRVYLRKQFTEVISENGICQ